VTRRRIRKNQGEKSEAGAKSKEEKKPADAVIPAGSYVVRMDLALQPSSRHGSRHQYYSSRDPRSYDDTGWTLGALRNVRTTRVTDLSILSAAMQKWAGSIPRGNRRFRKNLSHSTQHGQFARCSPLPPRQQFHGSRRRLLRSRRRQVQSRLFRHSQCGSRPTGKGRQRIRNQNPFHEWRP